MLRNFSLLGRLAEEVARLELLGTRRRVEIVADELPLFWWLEGMTPRVLDSHLEFVHASRTFLDAVW